MSRKHFDFWPKGCRTISRAPATNLFYNAEVSATRYPDKPFVIFFETPLTFGQFRDEAERLAGFLQQDCGVAQGDRVLLVMQNSPQFIVAYYAILRANAIVVPVNPMSVTAELEHYVHDSGARIAIVAQEVFPQFQPLLEDVTHTIVAAYSDYVTEPDHAAHARGRQLRPVRASANPDVTPWSDALARNRSPGPLTMGPDDLCVIPYSSGTTGRPKGCMLTHRNVMHTAGREQPVVRRAHGLHPARGAAVLSCHQHAGRHERTAVPGQHHRADVPLGPRCRGGTDPALPGRRRGPRSRRW